MGLRRRPNVASEASAYLAHHDAGEQAWAALAELFESWISEHLQPLIDTAKAASEDPLPIMVRVASELRTTADSIASRR
jgi:hypothetical protein